MYSIIIPNYGIKGIHMIDNLLNSISHFYNPSLDEIVISDDGSNIETMQELTNLIEKYKTTFKIIPVFNPIYHSFSKTVNSGIQNSNPNNNILLLNNDMLALTSFEYFTDFINNNNNNNNNNNSFNPNSNIGNNNKINNKIGIIGAKLLYPNLTIQHVGIVRKKFSRDFDHIYLYEDSNYPDAQIARKYLVVTGACMYISRELINKIGLLDENYVLSYEDVDYCINAHFNNYDVWYIPDVSLIHYESATRDNSHDIANRELFWKKWDILYEKIESSYPTEQKELAVIGIVSSIGLMYLLKAYSRRNS